MARRGWALFGAMCLIWGIPYLLIKVAVRHISPPDLVFGRTLIGAVLLLPIAAWRKELSRLLPFWRPLVAYTIAELAVPWLLLSDAERHLPSSLSGLLVAAVPFAGAVIGRMTGQPALGRTRMVGLAVGIAGVVVLLGLDLHGAHPASVVEIAVVVVGYALGPNIAARKLSEAPSLAVVAASLTLCSLIYLPWVATHLPSHLPGARPVAAVVTLGVVCTALAFVLFFRLIDEVGPSRCLVITYVNPAVAVLLGVAVLHESFGWSAGVGFVLILVGSYVSTSGRWQGRKPQGPEKPGPPEPVPGEHLEERLR
jgi:drug/metabolite transporter (DMT)-like permease